MFGNLSQILWHDLRPLQRLGLIVGLLALCMAFVWATVWLQRDTYQVLFSDLDPQDGSTMLGELDRMKVPYRVTDNGNTILVDREQVYKTRLQLMGKGLNLKGNVGFEIFNNAEFGVTEFAQKVNYLRALQGELARTIMAFDEIKFARVHLVLPESGVFKRGGVEPKASISLVMKDGARLRPEQIAGIQRLVAASVPEIKTAAVTVLDQRGIALNRAADPDGEFDGGGGKLEMKKQTEAYLAKKVTEILDRAFGPGQAVASVDVVLNQDQIRSSREDILPLTRKDGEAVGAVVRKRSQSQGLQLQKDYQLQQSNDAAREAPRVPGSASLDVEYANGRKVEHTVTMPGGIRRISVGILMPGQADKVQVERITRVVAMAVGLNPERGDAIAVFSMDQMLNRGPAGGPGPTGADTPPPAPASTAAAPSPASRTELPDGLLQLGALGVVLTLAILVFLLRIVRKREPAATTLTEAERERVLAQVRGWLASGAQPVAKS